MEEVYGRGLQRRSVEKVYGGGPWRGSMKEFYRADLRTRSMEGIHWTRSTEGGDL